MKQTKRMFIVGGYVRDYIANQLGYKVKPSTDKDWVVVGYTEQEMIDLGYTKVGASFPVFLHPETKEEYALARTERKIGVGHKGFEFEFGPDISLEQDLARRDLTINAIAMDPETGEFIDPLEGISALIERRFLECNRNSFSDDQLRVLRVARFSADFPEFTNFTEPTVNIDEIRSLSVERVFIELNKAMGSVRPSNFFSYLIANNYLDLFPWLYDLMGVSHKHIEDVYDHTMMCIDAAYDPEIRWMLLFHDSGKGETDPSLWPSHTDHEKRSEEIATRELIALKAPAKLIKLVSSFARNHMKLHAWESLRPNTILQFFEHIRFEQVVLEQMLRASCYDESSRIRPGYFDQDNQTSDQNLRYIKLSNAMRAAKKIQGRDFVDKYGQSPKLKEIIQMYRINAIKEAMK